MSLNIVRINDPEALDHLARCEVYQAISDYELCCRMLRKNPIDSDACIMMEDCEEFILRDRKVRCCIKDPVEFLNKLDEMIESDYRRISDAGK